MAIDDGAIPVAKDHAAYQSILATLFLVEMILSVALRYGCASLSCLQATLWPLTNAAAHLYLSGLMSLACRDQGLAIRVSSQLPMGAGLGSSGAFSIALAGALFKYQSPHLDGDQFIRHAALQAERIFHGTPSGLDSFTSLTGGIIVADSGVFTPLPSTFNGSILIVNSRISRITREMVSSVRARYQKDFKGTEHIIQQISNISARAEGLLRSMTGPGGDYLAVQEELHHLLEANQRRLHELGVSCEAIEDACRVLREVGIPAKLTGAGGGGCIIGVIPTASDLATTVQSYTSQNEESLLREAAEEGKDDKVRMALRALRDANMELFTTSITYQGLLVNKYD